MTSRVKAVFLESCMAGVFLFAAGARAFAFDGSRDKPAIDKTRTRAPEIAGLSRAMEHYIIGEIYDNYGMVDAAAEEYRKALKHKKDVSEIHVKLGADLLAKGELGAAEEELDEALGLAPESDLPRLFMAIIHTKRNEYDKAEKEYQKILDSDPENIRALAFLSDLFVMKGDLDNAAKTYEKMLSVDGTNAFLYFNLGVIYGKTDQLDKAAESLRKAIAINEGYVEAHMVLGVVHEIRSNFREAIRQYESAAETDPLNKEARARSGHAYFRSGQLKKAAREFRTLMELDPRSPDPYLNIFSIYVLREKYLDAESVLKEALANGVSDAVIYGSLGYLSLIAGDYAAASDYYSVAAEKDPGEGFYRFYLALSMDKSGEADKAVQSMENAIKDGIVYPEIYNYLGYVYAEKGEKLDRAAELIRKARALDPKNAAYIDSMGWVFYKQGAYGKALSYIKKAYELMPDNPVVAEHLGDAYHASGEDDEAVAAWERALSLDPENGAISDKIAKARETRGVVYSN